MSSCKRQKFEGVYYKNKKTTSLKLYKNGTFYLYTQNGGIGIYNYTKEKGNWSVVNDSSILLNTEQQPFKSKVVEGKTSDDNYIRLNNSEIIDNGFVTFMLKNYKGDSVLLELDIVEDYATIPKYFMPVKSIEVYYRSIKQAEYLAEDSLSSCFYIYTNIVDSMHHYRHISDELFILKGNLLKSNENESDVYLKESGVHPQEPDDQ